MSRLASLCFWRLTPVHDGTQRYQPRGHIIWVSGSSSSRAARAGGRGVDHLPTSSRLEQPSSLSPREREPQRHPLTRLIMFNRMCVRQCWLPAFVLWTCSYCPEPSFSHSYNYTAQLTPSASAVATLTTSSSGQSKLTALLCHRCATHDQQDLFLLQPANLKRKVAIPSCSFTGQAAV